MATVHSLSLPLSPHFIPNQSLSLTPKTPLLITFTTLSPPLPSLSLSTSRKLTPFLPLFSASATEIELEAKPKDEIEEEEEDEGSRTRIIAQNVPWSSTVDDIRALFEKFGSVVSVEMSMYNKTRNRGLAFITMGSHEEASTALSNLQSLEFEGRTLNLEWAKPRKKIQPPSTPPKQEPTHSLYVANLPFQARAKDLREFFKSDTVNAVSADIIFRTKPRISAGYGFVSFSAKDEAEAALSAFQGKEFMGRTIRLSPSKRFMRQGTKENIKAETESTETSSTVETSEEPV